jgi:hypothetical protein
MWVYSRTVSQARGSGQVFRTGTRQGSDCVRTGYQDKSKVTGCNQNMTNADQDSRLGQKFETEIQDKEPKLRSMTPVHGLCSGQRLKKEVHDTDSLNVLRPVVPETVEELRRSRKCVNLSYSSL